MWGGSSTTTLGNGLPGAVFDNGALYDVVSRRWKMMPNGPLGPRQDVAAVWAGDEAVFWGGDRPVTSGYQDYANGATYNPATARWNALPPAPISARRGAEAFWTGAQVVVFGGQGSSVVDVPLGGASYDVAQGTWSNLPSFPKTGTGSPISTSAVWTGSELLAVVTYEHIVPIPCAKCEKGYSISSRAVVAAWSPGWGSWHVLAGTPPHSEVAASTYMARATWTGREIVLLGGYECLPGMSCPALLGPSDAAIAFDPANHTWKPLGVQVGGGVWPSSWTGQALALLAAGGEYQGSQEPFTSAGSAAAFDAATDTWSPLPHLPVSPSDASMVWTGRQLLAWGSTSAERDFTATLTPANVTTRLGYVEGSVQPCVGPVGSEPRPGAVMAVIANHSGHIAAMQFVQAPFNFRLVLPPGRYTITASNDIARAVTVRAGVSDAVDLHSACL
jgi:hypothetical protein